MADTVSPEVRSRMMSGIRGKDTKPEWLVRRALHARGFRYRLHDRRLAGHPDLVFPRHQAVVFVHGCFWHGHEGCRYFRLPGSRTDFWEGKITRNRSNDAKNHASLRQAGWRVANVWECALRGAGHDAGAVADTLAAWIRGDQATLEIRG
ncbi:very short patch repair endonuclease [Luteimonas sp. A482]